MQWVAGKDAFELTVEVPDGVTARVSLPPLARPNVRVTVDGEPAEAKREGQRRVVEVGSGRHMVTLR